MKKADKSIAAQHHQTFEGIRQFDAEGNEYWTARQLARVLEYSEYRHFLPVIERAREACRNSGHPEADHFEDVLDMVEIGSGARRQVTDIHAAKGLKKSQKILDHMGSTELAANLFRATQTEEKLRRENVRGKQKANQTHFEVGQKVRQTIADLGGTMPEALPTPEASIQQLEKGKKKLEKKK